jgi:apolipoprotein N-acyltransferase
MRASPWRDKAGPVFWPACAGAAQAASIAWPGSGQAQAWLQVLSLTFLAAGLAGLARQPVGGPFAESSPVKRAAVLGGVFATAWLAGSFWWLYVSMHHVGGLPAPLALLAVLALAGALALYYAAASAVWVGLARGWVAQQPGLASVLFAALW